MTDDNVVFLRFRNPETVEDDTMAFIACKYCRNKTYTLVDQPGTYPLLRCACCMQHLGSMGWADSEDVAAQ